MALFLLCGRLPPMRDGPQNAPLPEWYGSTLPVPLTREEETRMFHIVHSDTWANSSCTKARTTARDVLVTANVPLVVFFAKRYQESLRQSAAVDLEDLVQEGTFGLLKAVELFDVRRDVRFSTYAGWHIRSALRRSSLRQMRALRLPERRAAQIARLRREIETHETFTRGSRTRQLRS